MPLRLPALPADPAAPFPPVDLALRHPDGLLAIGGDLSPERLVNAYRSGIFPWFSDGQPILWWSPDPRTVFHSDAIHLSTRFRRTLRQSDWILRADVAFDAVIDACANVPRAGQHGTWITAGMREAYLELHRRGHAHSVEVWDGPRMVGGIYGVAVGAMFFGESMFSLETGGSKAALAGLGRYLSGRGCPLIDAQVENPHLMSLGAVRMARGEFMGRIEQLVGRDLPVVKWTDSFGAMPAAVLAGISA